MGWDEPAETEPAGFGIRAYSEHGWITVTRDPHTGEVEVRLRQGSLRGRSEPEVAAEIRSALVAAATEYTSRHREQHRRRHGETPEYLRAWARTS